MRIGPVADGVFVEIRAALGPLADAASLAYYVLLDPLFRPSSRLFLPHLLLYVALGAWLFRRRATAAPAPSSGVLGALFPRSIYTHPSARQDYAFFVVAGALGVLFLSGIQVISSAAVARLVATHLGDPAAGAGLEFGLAAKCALTLCLFLAFDLATYTGHRLQHRVPWLWEFHKVHHSAQVLTPVTNYREHFIDTLLIAEIGACLAGLVGGVFQHLYGAAVAPFTVVGVLALTWVFGLTANFRHSHVWVSYGYRLDHVFSSPALHMLHHSSEPRHWDRNYGLALSVWDVLLGTAYIPRQREEFRLGLSDRSEADYAPLWAKFLLPFWRCLRPRSVADAGRQESC